MQDALGSVQSVLVLGGASDIARSTCRRLAADGARRFLLAGRNLKALDAAAIELAEIDGVEAAQTIEFDGAALETHPAFVDTAFERLGEVDLVLVTFGVLDDQEKLSADRQATLDHITVNYVGVVSVLMPAVDKLKAQGHGVVVVVSSVAAERARRSLYTYASAKAGLDWFLQGLDDDLRAESAGVRVMIVRPGFVTTKMTSHLDKAPLSVTADDVADAIVTGLAKGSGIVWVPPAMRWVMSGLRHAPRAVFRKLPI